jgi:hypothetical protein
VNELVKVGRIALRHEGDWWVAYWAGLDSMKDAVELARVGMGYVQDTKRKNQFIKFARDIFADAVEEKTGIRPQFPDEPQPAPAHEPAGHG